MRNPNANPRIYFLAGIFILAFGLIFARSVYIQVALEDLGKAIGNQASIKEKNFDPVRGDIYDRWGNLLAGNVEVFEIGVNLIHLRDITEAERKDFARELNYILEIDEDLVYDRINIEYDKDNAVFSTVYQNASSEMIDKIIEAREDNDLFYAISWNSRLTRRYPENDLAMNILGFYSDQGYYGVEGFYENTLSTNPSTTYIDMAPFEDMEIPVIPHGSSVMLTIDREIQASIERIVDDAVEQNGALSGTIIVMDPNNGEILGMATTPRTDLNLPWQTVVNSFPMYEVNGEMIQTPFNRAIMQTYEPGSVFKVITMASAFDAGVKTPDTEFIDIGGVDINGAYVENWDYGAWGPQTMKTCMQHSLNTCLATVAKDMGNEIFYNYLYAFNIDRKTNVDMAGEQYYPLLSPQNPTPFGSEDFTPRWDDRMLAYHSFGQGVAVTPLRMISSISALANDGRIMQPHIRKATIKEDGTVQYYNPMIVSTPIKPETAETMTYMLADSLEVESSDALVEGYRVAGKTGTAEIPTLAGYTENLTNASFVGWGPLEDPQFIVYIWLEKPTSNIWSSVVAAPVFRDVVEELVILMDIPPDAVRNQMASE